ncbi:MAG: M48 family metalloprotease [Aquabacterium sp.]|jgi:Zn-dependent protease with chaperone function|uniref:M48 family metalloprotease n=1 Tax=Aquabacterium sp. TaxID=1872578 RepID=UPI002A35B232|nr:M48 family metalloprotease [Aquabacterium sp.]MDX9844599.1 M48 family metalloprotease [Aquabacterium sp.]
MRFRQHQGAAQTRTIQLMLWFGVLVVALTLAINLLLALVYKLVVPTGFGFPNLFFETNTAVVLLFVVGGAIVETQRLRAGGGARVAHWLGGVEVTDPDDALERRLLNVVDEMAIASAQPVPRVFVMRREDAINGFVAGWSADDLALTVTRGALERLNRAELQGLVAHEFGHIKEDDLPLSMRMLALVWGLSLIHGYGQTLMRPNQDGQVNPLAWLVGLVLTAAGWLGWLAGRILQAAISRQREFLADASAIQFTRTSDGLGNVLRKIWHDQKLLAGRMQHPAAEMVAAMLLHEPGQTHLLACHPRLSERIRRVCGTVLPPLPARLLREPVSEPRRPRATTAPEGALAAVNDGGLTWVSAGATTSATPASVQHDLIQAHSEGWSARLHADREALARLQRLQGPTEQRLLLLALMMDPANGAERRWWDVRSQELTHGARILDDVQALLPQHRMPEFERLTAQLAGAPIAQRRQVVHDARELLRADGRISPRDRLWWLTLRHRLNAQPGGAPLILPLTHHHEDISDLPEAERAYVAALSAYLARFIPMPERADGVHPASQVWYDQVMQRCGEDMADTVMPQPPDADGLVHALSAVQELGWVLRAILVKSWVEEAFNHSPQGLLSDETADALRMCACLLDTPLPPMLEAHYRATR